MSDLPRFHSGAQGKLDFKTLNEAFRRLDALRPLIEAAAISGKLNVDLKPLIFPVFASELTPDHPGKYGWQEVLLRDDDTVVIETDEDYDEIRLRSQIREGGKIDDKTNELDDNYGIVLDPTVSFNSGFCLCAVIRRIDAANRYILFPQSVAEGPGGFDAARLFKVNQPTGEVTWNPGSTGNITAQTYSGLLFEIAGDTQTVRQNVTLYDWSRNRINEPLSSSTSVSTFYHVLDSGTILSVGPIHDGNVHFGAPCRLDFECT